MAGTPRAYPDRQPYSRPPATPPQAAPRPEPRPINGAIPRPVDAPAPRQGGHRAAPTQQPIAAPQQPIPTQADSTHGFGADRRAAATHEPPPAAARHAAAAGTSARQPSAEQNPAVADAGTESWAGHDRAPAQSPISAAPAPPPATPADPVPIARLAASGPDTTKRRYADADLGATWFTAKTAAAPEPVIAAGRTGPGSDPAALHTDGRPPVDGPGQDTTTERGRANGGAPADVGPTRPIPRQAAPADTAQAADDAAGDHASVVIDLDITGLINGLGITSEEPADATRTPGTGDETGREGTAPAEAEANARASAQRVLPPMPGSSSTEVQPVAQALKPLSAEDLDAIRWRLDGGTLREVVDDREALRELGGRLDEPLAEEQDNVARSGLLSVRAEVYRLLGELGLAAAASRLAMAHAEAAGDVQAIVIAQAELAHVLRLRGDFAEADRLFEEAASSDSPEVLRSVVHENAGRSCFDQGRQMEALDHFARAIRLGAPADLDLVERIGVCLEAVYIHVLRDGWGPYPRLRREILGPVRGPHPAPDAAPTANRGSTLD